MRQRLRSCFAVFIFAVALLAVQRASPQSSTSGTGLDPVEILRSLTPEQRDQISRQIGGMGGQSTGGRNSRDNGNDTNRSDNNRDRTELSPEDEELRPQPLILRGGDSIIVEVDFHRIRPKPAPTLPTVTPAPDISSGVASPDQTPVPSSALQAVQPQQLASLQEQEPEPVLTAEEKLRLQKFMAMIRAKNPYRLSRDGVLQLPGFAGIPLAGLTAEQATLRLEVEPAFRNLDVMITILPLKKLGTEGLKPFGYDLFRRSPSTFAPVTNVPVPADYIVGPDDQLEVQLYGNQNRTLELTVSRDGRINFPELGPISVSGQRFTNVKSDIEARVERQMIGVRASVSMGDTRSIRVFVLGEAQRPGSYTISGLGTVTSALYAAGGIKPIGSLRRIALKRHGALVRELDLYDLLIHGNTTDDARLLPGDVVFIPAVGPTVSVDGEVRRPAIYETKGEASVADLVALAGGLTPEADISKATLTRIDDERRRIVVQIDLSVTKKAEQLHNGDALRIERLRPTLDAGVLLQGHLFAPGTMAYRDGMRLSDVIHSVDELQPNADIHYILIRRELAPDRRIVALSADLAAALQAPGSKADPLLMARDRITIFDLESGRDRVIQPLLDELRLQSRIDRPTELVHVDGRVKVPGDYPLETGMTVSDLVRAGGSLSDAAYGGRAELTRYEVVNGETRRTQLLDIDLVAALKRDPSADIALQPYDSLSIKEVSDWSEQEKVELVGEVRFPGTYSIKRGETLSSVIRRAGGLTTYAFAEGSVFTRDELKRREQEQLDRLAERLQNDLALMALRGAAANQAGAATALSVGQSLLGQLKASKAVGRLVIDLPRTVHAGAGSSADVILRNGDRLLVPKVQQEVTVIGEVQNQTSHLYQANLNRDDYVNLSGGMTRRADSGRVYVVRANGSVISGESSRWFRSGAMTVKPGDTVVVPMDTEKLPALPFWQAVTSIIYNLAISAAAVHSF